MRLLLDTHIFLWYISGDPKLPTDVRDRFRDLDNEVFLSVVSVWEATIKHSLGKLPLPETAGVYLPEQRERHGISSLPPSTRRACRISALYRNSTETLSTGCSCARLSNMTS